MGFHLHQATLHTLNTPEEACALAQKLDALGVTTCERPLDPTRSQNIYNVLTTGQTLPFTWAVGIVQEPAHKGKAARCDGQHGSKKFLDLSPDDWKKVRFPLKVLWQDYHCDTLRDLPVLFEQFNRQWSARSDVDLIGAHLGIHEGLIKKVERKLATKLTAGLSWYATKVNDLKKVKGRQFNIIHDSEVSQPFLEWAGAFLHVKKTAEMLSLPVIGAMRHTFAICSPEENRFWKMVSEGKPQNEEGTPAYKLATFLEMYTDSLAEWPRPMLKHFKKKPSEGQVFATCLNAFSAHAFGKRIGDVFVPVKKEAIKALADGFKVPKSEAAAA